MTHSYVTRAQINQQLRALLAPATAAHCSTLQHTATHCNALQRTATHCNALQQLRAHSSPQLLQHTAAHCNTLQHTATHCNTLQQLRALLSPANALCFKRCPLRMRHVWVMFTHSYVLGVSHVFGPESKSRESHIGQSRIWMCASSESHTGESCTWISSSSESHTGESCIWSRSPNTRDSLDFK